METDNTIDTDSAAIFEKFQLKEEVDNMGVIRYYNKDGLLHREFGPAVITPYGLLYWFYHGKHHRIGGPATIGENGYRLWYLKGKNYTEEKYWKKVKTNGKL